MRLSLLLLVGMALLGGARRGEVYGTVRLGKQFLAGVEVAVTTASGTVSDTTDKFGAYRVFVKEAGKCTLTVRYQKQAPTLEIVSVGDAVRYRLVLEEANGKYTLHSE
jgi:hypothetical protein